MKNRFITISTFLTVMALIYTAYPAQQAPGFALLNNRGEYVYKSKLSGNLIISFWASYCKPCKIEMPALVEIEKKYGKTKNLQLVFINIDDNTNGSAREKADKMMKDMGIEHKYLLDSFQQTILKYNPGKSVPATFLVNKQGVIVFSEVGAHPDTIERLEKAIQKLR